jgi:ribosomal protein L11 methyltransferase
LEEASNYLLELDVLSVSILPKEGTNPEFGFDEAGENIFLSSEKDVLSFIIDEHINPSPILKSLSKKLSLENTPKFNLSMIEDRDWIKHTQNQFSEIVINESLRILPPWETKSPFNGESIIIEPGSAFGTGDHPTTHLCLDWLSKNIKPENHVLDFGCGSAILLIAALQLGAGTGTGVDIDPLALENAKHNCTLNQVNPTLCLSQDFHSGQFDIIVANILCNPLIALAPLLAENCNTNGQIILAGILEHQISQVIDAYNPYFSIELLAQKEEWVLLGGKKKSK